MDKKTSKQHKTTDMINEASKSIGHLVLNTIHPLCVSIVEFKVDLIQLTLQPREGDIIVNPEQMGWFPPSVVNCS